MPSKKVSGIQCIGAAFTELSCRLDVEPHVRGNVIPGISSANLELCICLLDLSVSLLTVSSRNGWLGRVCNTVTTRRAVDHMTDAFAVRKRTNFRFRAMTAGRCPSSRRRLKVDIHQPDPHSQSSTRTSSTRTTETQRTCTIPSRHSFKTRPNMYDTIQDALDDVSRIS